MTTTFIPPTQMGLVGNTQTITSNYSIDSLAYPDFVILCSFPGSSRTVTMPAPTLGRMLMVKDVTGNAGAGSSIALAPFASETIDGASSYTINVNYGGLLLGSDGTNWFVLAAYNGTVI